MQNEETPNVKSAARLDLESNVKAVHKNFPQEWIDQQSNVILLRFAHPDDQSKLATALVNNEEISNRQASEFIKYYR